jgi:hypothetical protein
MVVRWRVIAWIMDVNTTFKPCDVNQIYYWGLFEKSPQTPKTLTAIAIEILKHHA